MNEENVTLTADIELSDSGSSGELSDILVYHSPFANPGLCEACRHPMYGPQVQYITIENNAFIRRHVNLSELAATSTNCGFCYILYEGVQRMRELWILEWAKCRWRESLQLHPDCDIRELEQEKPWGDDYRYLLTINDIYQGSEKIPHAYIVFRGERYSCVTTSLFYYLY